MSERNPSRRYVTGFSVASVANHPLNASFGRNEVVRKANGKNRMKLDATAPGLPVFSAMAYGNPVNTTPHAPDMAMKTSTPRMPVSNRTPVANPSASTGRVRPITSTRSATMRPSSSARRRIGVIRRRSK